jgi:hypothetical protein
MLMVGRSCNKMVRVEQISTRTNKKLNLKSQSIKSGRFHAYTYFFKQLSGLKIIFYKSKIFCFGTAKEVKIIRNASFRPICEVRSLLFKYLGIHIYYRKLLNEECT